MTKYKWDSPQEWLSQKINATDDVAKLRGIVTSVVDLLDADEIQDTFQSEMDDDGYFKPDLDAMIRDLPREACVRLLEGASIQCYDSEGNNVLREAVRVNYNDGTLSADDITAAQDAQS